MSYWKQGMVIAGAVTALTGALVGLTKAWPIMDPWLLAHRGYVLEHIGGVQATTNELLIWKNEDNKSRAKADQDNWSIQLQKEKDPQTRSMIQKRVNEIDKELETYNNRLKQLKGQ